MYNALHTFLVGTRNRYSQYDWQFYTICVYIVVFKAFTNHSPWAIFWKCSPSVKCLLSFWVISVMQITTSFWRGNFHSSIFHHVLKASFKTHRYWYIKLCKYSSFLMQVTRFHLWEEWGEKLLASILRDAKLLTRNHIVPKTIPTSRIREKAAK